jgi:hypothetical protein
VGLAFEPGEPSGLPRSPDSNGRGQPALLQRVQTGPLRHRQITGSVISPQLSQGDVEAALRVPNKVLHAILVGAAALA